MKDSQLISSLPSSTADQSFTWSFEKNSLFPWKLESFSYSAFFPLQSAPPVISLLVRRPPPPVVPFSFFRSSANRPQLHDFQVPPPRLPYLEDSSFGITFRGLKIPSTPVFRTPLHIRLDQRRSKKASVLSLEL